MSGRDAAGSCESPHAVADMAGMRAHGLPHPPDDLQHGNPEHRMCLILSFCVPRFDVPAFYWEARRVLKPGGALVAWGYYFPEILQHPAADHVLR